MKVTMMAENKGRGVKGRGYDELSGVGTSSAGITGTTGNLNTGGRDGGIGEPPIGDAGNRQMADHGLSDATPALGRAARTTPQNRQSAQAGSSSGGTAAEDQNLKDTQDPGSPDDKGGSQSG
jgi:hypothetical protein